jgi:hypothetical protein
LTDDTIEVRADRSKDGFAVFLKKQKLPKGKGRLCIFFYSQADNKEFVTFGDLVTGSNIDIFGRSFFLYDCDAATR